MVRGVAEVVGRRGGRRAVEEVVGVGVGVGVEEGGVEEGVEVGVVVVVGEDLGEEEEVTVAMTEVVATKVEVEKMGDVDVAGVVDDGVGEAVTTGSIVVVTVELETPGGWGLVCQGLGLIKGVGDSQPTPLQL